MMSACDPKEVTLAGHTINLLSMHLMSTMLATYRVPHFTPGAS
jgi:hypothetical protein